MIGQFLCVTLSDFNLDNFNSLLANDDSQPSVGVIETDYGQVRKSLLDPDAACWKKKPDCAVVWTRPEAAVPTFRRLRNFEAVDPRNILEEVDEFANQLIALADRVDTVLVPSWTTPPKERGLGLLDMQNGVGIANILMRMNLRLSEALADRTGFFVLDASRWIQKGGDSAYSPKLWAMAKVPFTSLVFKTAVDDVKGALHAIRGDTKKLIVLDLDGTLWGGVVGECGWENLQVGGHDALGEAYADFQRALKAMTNRGILLGIVSKNTEEVALEAFERHPEMVLSLNDFAGWRINWDDKAKNVAALIEELNLGRRSAVFIDNNSFERGRVREALPEVFVPEWPDDPFRYRQKLLALRCFDTVNLTQEDRERASMYVQQRKRSSVKREVDSLDEWLQTLGMTVEVEPFTNGNRARVVQLLNKTNQMNLRTRRMSEAEFVDWLDHDGRCFRAFRVSDRFGESGLTGILSIVKVGHEAHLTDFILSCRVMGRQVEDAMLAVATEEAQRLGAEAIIAEYRPTEKNSPCLEFWQESGFETDGSEHVFRWSLDKKYAVPVHIEVRPKSSVGGAIN
jgi:FkbH-like protein